MAVQAFERTLNGFEEKVVSLFGEWVTAPVFGSITWFQVMICLFILFGVALIERAIRWLLLKKAGPLIEPGMPGTLRSALLRAGAKPLSLFIWMYGLCFALFPLYPNFQATDGGNPLRAVVDTAVDFGATFAIVWLIYRLVDLLDVRLMARSDRTKNAIDNMLMPLIGTTLRVFILVIGAMILIQNVTGIEIGPLLASLGIGGLAVALAAKDSIANFFGTLTILLDKPFRIGERIVIDKYDGVVEMVGFRSTRIRLLTGHLVTIPNEKVVNMGLENIGKRPNIRWLTNIGITYDTPTEKAERAVEIIRDILEGHEGFHPDFPPRVFFNGFNDWSLNILVVVWYHPPEYWDFQAWVQKTCLAIMKRFREEGIDFAFPSQTLYMAGDEKRPLKINPLAKNSEATIDDRV
jgi:MscS family membrane protein